MIYKKVAKINEEISAIGIGCWNMGGDWDSSEESKSIDVIHAAIDMGVNLFDVAPVYGWGNSEKVLGKALKQDGLRNKVLIASKAGLTWDKPHHTANNLSKESLLKEIDDSLMRLQTDHIDISLRRHKRAGKAVELHQRRIYPQLPGGRHRFAGCAVHGLLAEKAEREGAGVAAGDYSGDHRDRNRGFRFAGEGGTGLILIRDCGEIPSMSCVVIRSRTTRSIRDRPMRYWF